MGFLFTHPFNLKELLVVFYPLIKNEIDLLSWVHGTSGMKKWLLDQILKKIVRLRNRFS
jgi:succinate dehydrogenase flavin-adding protein (antitoxin of CptAB toxin-antitoxin module)